jgi:indole-3-glycerol phosphate synthase/phosphoribosylanthranilate isomerase
LVEVHDARDVATIRRAAPPVVGINSRDLATFTVDPLTPVRLRNHIDWSPTLVFESGVHSDSDVRFARSAGFRGVLVGESVTRDPTLVPRLLNAFDTPLATGRFWTRLGIGRPLIKICGIAREDDGRLAAELGADILGFIFAPSPRRATSEVVERLADVNVPKVAVVAETTNANRGLSDGQPIVPRTVETLLNDGLLDAVQFHGDENPTDLAHFPYPSYKALRIRSEDDVALMDDYRTPRVLIDAFAEDVRGGSGKRIAAPLVSAAARKGPLWLAGGLNPENIRQVIEELDPELVDASSGLEARPGVKDEKKLERFFREIRNAQSG